MTTQPAGQKGTPMTSRHPGLAAAAAATLLLAPAAWAGHQLLTQPREPAASHAADQTPRGCVIARESAATGGAPHTVRLLCGPDHWEAVYDGTTSAYEVANGTPRKGWALEEAEAGPVIGHHRTGTAVVFTLTRDDGQKCEVSADFFGTTARQRSTSPCATFDTPRTVHA